MMKPAKPHSSYQQASGDSGAAEKFPYYSPNVEPGIWNPDHRIRLTAHDLRTPLQAIRLYADALALKLRHRGNGELEIDGWLKSVDGIKNCVGEMNSMLNLLGGESDQVFCEAGIRETIEDVKRICPGAEKLLILSSNALPIPPIAREKLFQVIQNLITNTIRHGGTVVRIDCTENEEFLDLHYSDDGPGIPSEVFSQCHCASPPPTRNGHGSGLWLLTRMLEANRGKLTASYHHGKSGICIRLLKSQRHSGQVRYSSHNP